MVFVDLTKAFDTVNRTGLWKILQKFGFPEKLTALIASFHDDMQARVQENGEASDPFQVSNGVKQGCVHAPTLFSFLFSAMLLDAFSDCKSGKIPVLNEKLMRLVNLFEKKNIKNF